MYGSLDRFVAQCMAIVSSVSVHTPLGESNQYPNLLNSLSCPLFSAAPLCMHQRIGISAGIYQYQYYKDTQYPLQITIWSLQNKEQHYLESAMKVLLDLENANVLGRLLAHADIISSDLLAHNAQIYMIYTRLACSFQGEIMQSALDIHINHHCQQKPVVPYHCNESSKE